ncbi:MAG TPA: hypothetical protein VJZ26_05255 [Blastocatellia bacterium]|nr:hypothetical protein [Blastocatellia bacterium]
MKKVAGIRCLMLIIAAAVFAAPALGQTSSLPNLPEADALVYMNFRRILGEALPRVLPEKLQADMKNGIDQIKQKTGIDLYGVENAAVALRFANMAAGAAPDFVFVVRGSFNADALLSAMRIALQGKYKEEKYGSKTLTSLNLSELMNSSGGKGGPTIPGVSEISVTALDQGTLAAGNPAYLKATIDAQGGQGGIKPELSALSMRDPNALFSVAGIIPPGLLNGIFGKQIQGNEEISKLVAGIDQVYLALGMDAANFTVLLTVRTGSAEHARTLSGLMDMVTHGMGSEIKDKAAKEALDALKVTVEDTEVQVRTAIPQDTAATFLRNLLQPPVKQAVSPTAPEPAPKATQKKPAQRRATAKKPARKP